MPNIKLPSDADRYIIDGDTPQAEQEDPPWGADASRINEDHSILC